MEEDKKKLKDNDSSLKVEEAYTRDVGRGVARIDEETRNFLSLTTGDVVEISANKKTVAKCLALYPADENKKIIRIDGLVRNNCKAEIGNIVSIRKIKTTAAESVMVAPLEAIPPIDPRYLADVLNDTPLIPKQLVMVPYFSGRLTFMVVGIIPELFDEVRAVVVTPKTKFGIVDKKPFSLFSTKDVEDKRHDFLQKIWTIESLSKSEFDDFVNKLTEFYNFLSDSDKENKT